MASIKLTGDTSGEITISAPAVAGTNTLTLPAQTGTVPISDVEFVTQRKTATPLIINGDMAVWQRGTSVTGITSTKTYTVDRWFGRSLSTSSMSVSQSTDAPDRFLYSAKCQKPSGQSATIMRFEQPFETNNIVHLRGQKVTVSFYAKKGADYSPTGDAFPVVIYAGNGTERARNITAFDNESVPLNTSVTLTSSWQRFSVTSSDLPSDLSQLALQFQPVTTVTAGADESFYITGVQLEVGSFDINSIPPFQFEDRGTSLARCQRYYQIIAIDDGVVGAGMAYSTTDAYYVVDFMTPMRTEPSAILTGDFRYYRGGSSALSSTYLIGNTTVYKTRLKVTGSGLTTGHGSWVQTDGGPLAMDAEL